MKVKNPTTSSNYHRPGGNMTHPTITLTPDPRGNYVTWAQGKKQVRAALRANGYKAVGLFRARKVNKNEFHIICVCERTKPSLAPYNASLTQLSPSHT